MSEIIRSEVTAEELKIINSFARADMKAEDVYAFRIVCCDNQIDRDFERFSDEAIAKMAELYVGKTIIKDHLPSADNQIGRIYKTDVESGENGSKRLVASAYIPKTESNIPIIENIESGVNKEVSVGCAVQKRICSICGKDIQNCSHLKSKNYEGKVCYALLDGVYDVYELSFVAVPSQKSAGVIKSFKAMPDHQSAVIGIDLSSGDMTGEAAMVQNRIVQSRLLCADLYNNLHLESEEN